MLIILQLLLLLPLQFENEYRNCSNDSGKIGGNERSVFTFLVHLFEDLGFDGLANGDLGDGAINSVREKNLD